jgi:hypothetical protein
VKTGEYASADKKVPRISSSPELSEERRESPENED